jgi:hypothetical protein
MASTFARRIGLTCGLALLALSCVSSSVAFADDHSGPGRDGGGRGRDGGDHGDRGDRGRDDQREVRVVAPNNAVVTVRAPQPRCASVDPSAATIDTIFNQFLANGGGLSLTQAALIGNALYLSADEVQELSFDQLIAMSQCAGVSLDTLSSILSGG